LTPLLSALELTKSFGATNLFRGVSFTLNEGERLGLIGPNGSGKSTLLRILAGAAEADTGEVALRKHATLAYVAQESVFGPDLTVRGAVEQALAAAAVPELDHEARIAETLGRAGFTDVSARAADLSGGWRKRLAIAQALVRAPSVLLLDEPTNHLDLAGIDWLEDMLADAPFAAIVISHDRYFLEAITTATAELNRVYPEGILRFPGPYSEFLEKRAAFLDAQAKQHQSLANRVRTEIEWLRRGAKARTTKSKARIGKANEMIAGLKDLDTRRRTATARIDFTGSDRRSRRLIEFEQVSIALGGRTLFQDLDLVITAGSRVGLIGPNGSGKTTLLRLIQGQLPPDDGTLRRAEALQIAAFSQHRELDPELPLRRALAPEGDSVIYRGRVVHVAGWAARFLFTAEQLNQPVGRLSGGERARVLIARLMLEPADVLLLDEPTNDLDIPTLEILEESLLEFSGALVLVSHDRYLLDRVSTLVLGLDGQGNTGLFADSSQCEAWLREAAAPKPAAVRQTPPRETVQETAPPRRKLGYLEAREYAAIEETIAQAEARLATLRNSLEDPATARDARMLAETYAAFEAAQQEVDRLYARWAELEAKANGAANEA